MNAKLAREGFLLIQKPKVGFTFKSIFEAEYTLLVEVGFPAASFKVDYRRHNRGMKNFALSFDRVILVHRMKGSIKRRTQVRF